MAKEATPDTLEGHKMSNLNATTETRVSREHGRSGRLGAALLLSIIGLIGLTPSVSSATPTFKIRIVDLSLPLAVTGEAYTVRTDVATTCTPITGGGLDGFGYCETIDVTVSWWTDAASPKVVQTHVLMVGGPFTFQIAAADVHAPMLHYRIVASQVWTGSGCIYFDTCPKIQTASVQISGSTRVM